MGSHDTERLNRVSCGGWDMTEEIRSTGMNLIILLGKKQAQLELRIEALESRLTDLEDRVTENGG